jgi:hypothetical protein
LVPILAEAGDPSYAAVRELVLGRARDDLPRAVELDAALCEVLGLSAGHRSRVRLSELLDRLVRYRNHEMGHGAVGHRPKEFHARMGHALLSGVSELLGRLDVLAGRRLVYVEEVRLQKSGHYLVEWSELSGGSARRIESLKRHASEAARLPRPEQVYLDARENRPEEEGSPAPLSLIPLRPLIVYDSRLDDVFFLNSGARASVAITSASPRATTRSSTSWRASSGACWRACSARRSIPPSSPAGASPTRSRRSREQPPPLRPPRLCARSASSIF